MRIHPVGTQPLSLLQTSQLSNTRKRARLHQIFLDDGGQLAEMISRHADELAATIQRNSNTPRKNSFSRNIVAFPSFREVQKSAYAPFGVADDYPTYIRDSSPYEDLGWASQSSTDAIHPNLIINEHQIRRPLFLAQLRLFDSATLMVDDFETLPNLRKQGLNTVFNNWLRQRAKDLGLSYIIGIHADMDIGQHFLNRGRIRYQDAPQEVQKRFEEYFEDMREWEEDYEPVLSIDIL